MAKGDLVYEIEVPNLLSRGDNLKLMDTKEYFVLKQYSLKEDCKKSGVQFQVVWLNNNPRRWGGGHIGVMTFYIKMNINFPKT